MKLRSLGMSDVKITPIIMGTWQAGKRMWAGIDDAEITKAIRAAFDAGITTFDTAEEYGWGHSERILGKALADVRHQVVYATNRRPASGGLRDQGISQSSQIRPGHWEVSPLPQKPKHSLY